MKAAIISPLRLLTRYSALSTTQMCLAQFCGNEEYRNYFLLRKDFGDFIIIDNGAYELRDSLDSKVFLDSVRELTPHVAIIPDSVMNKRRTLKLSEEFLLLWDKCPVGKTELMVVPQGANAEEWSESLDELMLLFPFKWIGVAKSVNLLFRGGRASPCGTVVERYPESQIHLLGIWNDPLEEAKQARTFEQVQVIDSSLPVSLGKLARSLEEFRPRPSGEKFLDESDPFPEWTRQQVERFINFCETGKLDASM